MPFKNKHLGENIIIADADYVDKVAFNLIVNFERMIGRHIPQADMAQWVECIALDGGCQEKPAEASTPLTSVILIHDVAKREMDNFNPGIFGDNLPPHSDEDIDESSVLNGRAFKGRLGEFSFSTLSGEAHQETMTKADIFLDVLAALADEHHVRRIMLVPDLEQDKGMAGLLHPVLQFIDRSCPDKRVTTFAMEPLAGMPCRTDILGYSLMAALGVKADELRTE